MNTNTNPIFAALSAAFVAKLDTAYQCYFGDEYADSYFSDAVDEANRRAGNLADEFLPFLADANAYGRYFDEWVAAQVPAYTDKLAALWVELGYPEPESDCGGDITDRMSCAVYDVIAEQARDAADALTSLAADFQVMFDAAAEVDADELVDDWMDDDEAAAVIELARRGIRSNYAGMYSISREAAGCIVQLVFDTATAALDAVLDKEAAAAAD